MNAYLRPLPHSPAPNGSTVEAERHEHGIDFQLDLEDRRLAAFAADELERQRLDRNRRDRLSRRLTG